MRRLLSCTLPMLALVSLIGCGDEVEPDAAPGCVAGESFDPIRGWCAPDRATGGGGEDAGTPDPSVPDGGSGVGDRDGGADTDTDGDVEPDSGPQDGSCPDRDGDGARDIACGGEDCDDAERSRAPGAAEVCDALDNDCDGALNNGIECVFYAHSTSVLYEIDPFAKTATVVGTADASAVDALFDIDTSPDGTLYGIAGNYLYSYDAATSTWTRFDQPLGANTGNANGMAIDNDGVVYITSSSKLFTADLATGAGRLVGESGYTSSGDAVVTKGNVLYMTATPASFFGMSDRLVKVDGSTAQVTPVGEIGFPDVWGLTAAWNQLYGLTSFGDLITIDPVSGQGTLVHRFPGVSFYGAASTPAR